MNTFFNNIHQMWHEKRPCFILFFLLLFHTTKNLIIWSNYFVILQKNKIKVWSSFREQRVLPFTSIFFPFTNSVTISSSVPAGASGSWIPTAAWRGRWRGVMSRMAPTFLSLKGETPPMASVCHHSVHFSLIPFFMAAERRALCVCSRQNHVGI